MILKLVLLAYWLLSIYCLFTAIKNRDNLNKYNCGWNNFIRSMICLIFAQLIFTVLIVTIVYQYVKNEQGKKINEFTNYLDKDIENSRKGLKENLGEFQRDLTSLKLHYQVLTLSKFNSIFKKQL